MDIWQKFDSELTLWQQPIKFWWRDDDAIADSDALQTMLTMAHDYAIAVHLAVIPNKLQDSLNVIKNAQHKALSFVLQHGVEHKSFALADQRKIELGGSQNSEQLVNKLALGRQRLQQVFDEQYLDILVPPWNRISDDIVTALPEIGYRQLSVLGGAKLVETDFHLNVHIDIINWKQRVFAGEDVILNNIIDHLRNKRLGIDKSQKPCGLMTHHLDHDQQCWQFLTKFFSTCQQHRNIQWLSGNELLNHLQQ
ncbi:hypothetical protein WN093_10275 [Gammaproteobacteria bacterium AS21]